MSFGVCKCENSMSLCEMVQVSVSLHLYGMAEELQFINAVGSAVFHCKDILMGNISHASMSHACCRLTRFGKKLGNLFMMWCHGQNGDLLHNEIPAIAGKLVQL